jgi:hypothetical protein
MNESELKKRLAKSAVANKNNVSADKLPQIKKEEKIKLPKVSANTLTKNVLRVLDLRGFYCWRQNNGAVYDEKNKCYRKNSQHLKGVPDIIGFNRKTALFVCVEIKAGSDQLSASQKEFLTIVSRANGLQFVVRTVEDIDVLNKKLNEIDKL